MRKASVHSCRQNKTHISCYIYIVFENLSVYEVVTGNMTEQNMPNKKPLTYISFWCDIAIK